MHVMRHAAMLLSAAVAASLICSGCPPAASPAKQELFLLNLNTARDIVSLKLKNQDTDEYDTVWKTNIPPGGFQHVVVALDPYIPNDLYTSVKFASETGLSEAGVPFDGTPIIFVLRGDANSSSHEIYTGGDSFAKARPHIAQMHAD